MAAVMPSDTTAVARELVGFLWAALKEVDVSQLQPQEVNQAA